MKQREFIDVMKKTLLTGGVADADEIVLEYEEHFANKLSDGYSEEEVAHALGDPEELAAQYDGARTKGSGGGRAAVVAGLALTDICVAMIFAVLVAWVAVIGAFSLVSAAAGIIFVLGKGSYIGIWQYPSECVPIFFAMLLALAVLGAIGTYLCALYLRQLLHKYRRWHYNALAPYSGKPVYPPLPLSPRRTHKARRVVRTVALFALAVFAVSFIVGYILAAVLAGNVEFWHVWGWFGN